MLRMIAYGFGVSVARASTTRSLPFKGGHLAAVTANRFYRATFHCLFAKAFFLGGLRLFINVRMAAIVIPFEVGRSGFPTKITVDTLVIDIKLTFNVLSVFVSYIGHNSW